jgi:hypothetical protein
VGHVLMTKFGKSGKIRLSSLLFRNIWFCQFQDKTKEGARLEDLKIQRVLWHEKGLKSIKEARWKKFKPNVEATKTGRSGFRNWSIQFS